MTQPSLYHLLSTLLAYPEPELLDALPEIDRLLSATPMHTGGWRRCSTRCAAPISSPCRNTTLPPSTVTRRMRCICSSTCTARAATAARPWST